MASAWSLVSLFQCTDYSQALLYSIAFSSLFLLFFYYNYSCAVRGTALNWPMIGMLPALIVSLSNLHDLCRNLLAAAGHTFTFIGPWLSGMDFLVTSDPANVHHIFTSNFPNYPKGPDFIDMFDLLGNSILGADGDSWSIQRRMSHAIITDRDFRSFAMSITQEKASVSLVPMLYREAETGETVDLDKLFMRTTFDITCKMVFGIDPGSLSLELSNVPFAKAMDDFWEAAFFRHTVPKSCWKLARRVGFGPERRMSQARKVVDGFIAEQILRKRVERMDSDWKRGAPDLLSSFMDQPFGEVMAYFGSEDEFLRDTVMFLMVAGRDAFSITLTWFFFILYKNPGAEAKILEELSTRRRKLPKGESAVFDAEELSSMVYLHGAICETLRLYPPVPWEHKCAMQHDILPSGHHVKPGTKILISIYTMGRTKEIWGEDWSEFRPERWLTEEGRIKHVPANKFMVFTSGPRSCLGKEIGLINIKMVVAAVLWNFKVEVVEGQRGEPTSSAMLRMKNGLKVRIRKRGV